MEDTIKQQWFEQWFDTPYYHLLFSDTHQKAAPGFIGKLLTHLNIASGKTILDVGCGEGGNSKLLAEKGFDVTGIDLTYNAIAAARQQENEHLQFYQHDLRQPFWINYFDLALNLFSNFGFYRTNREHDAAMRTIGQSISETGTLVIDYTNTHYAEDHLVHSADQKVGGYNFHLTKWMDEEHFYRKIEVEHDSFTEPHIYTEKLAKFSLGDFTDMLAFNGLQVKEVFGDYDLGSYHVSKTPRMIMVAQKIR